MFYSTGFLFFNINLLYFTFLSSHICSHFNIFEIGMQLTIHVTEIIVSWFKWQSFLVLVHKIVVHLIIDDILEFIKYDGTLKLIKYKNIVMLIIYFLFTLSENLLVSIVLPVNPSQCHFKVPGPISVILFYSTQARLRLPPTQNCSDSCFHLCILFDPLSKGPGN